MATAQSEVESGRMTFDLAQQIQALSRETKEKLVILLQEELDGGAFANDLPLEPADDPDAVRTAWKVEIARRIEDMRTGRVQGIDVYESLARIEKKLKEKYGA